MESFYPCPLILNRCGILNQDFLSRKENREVPQTKEISSTSIFLLRGQGCAAEVGKNRFP